MVISIGFSRPRKWKVFSELIKLWFGTKYSHVYIRIHSENLGVEYVYQSSGTHVNFMGAEIFDSINETLHNYTVNINNEQYKNFLRFAMTNSGKPYDIKSVLAIALKRFGIKSKKLNDNDYSYICSELVATILQGIGFKFNKPNNEITPKDLKAVLDSK